MRSLALIATAALLAGADAAAQTTADAPDPAAPAKSDPILTDEAIEKAWSFSASASFNFVPDSRDYVQPTFTADRDWLHLELRYNYEALDTASAWVGFNFSGGKELTWQFTPMLGCVFGDTTGVAPGYEVTLSWWKLQFYTEGEYVFNTDESSESFFYSWSELTLSPVEWFQFGLAVQRTRVYETDRDVQVGPFVGFTFEHLNLSAYAFNLDEDKPIIVFTVGVTF